MIYMSGDVKIMILETANLEELKKGRPAKSPDGTVLVAWCPDVEWLGRELAKSGGDGRRIAELIDEAAKRPEKPTGPYRGMKKVEFHEDPGTPAPPG